MYSALCALHADNAQCSKRLTFGPHLAKLAEDTISKADLRRSNAIKAAPKMSCASEYVYDVTTEPASASGPRYPTVSDGAVITTEQMTSSLKLVSGKSFSATNVLEII